MVFGQADLFRRSRKPGGPRSGSREARCRQGAGEVDSLPCSREGRLKEERQEPLLLGMWRLTRIEYARLLTVTSGLRLETLNCWKLDFGAGDGRT